MVSFWTPAWGRETSAAALEQRGVWLNRSCGRGTTGHVPNVTAMGDTEGGTARTGDAEPGVPSVTSVGCRRDKCSSWREFNMNQQLQALQGGKIPLFLGKDFETLTCCFFQGTQTDLGSSCPLRAGKGRDRIKTLNTGGTAGVGICYALLDKRDQYFSSPKAGLLFFLYLMFFQPTASLDLPVGFVLQTPLVSAHLN